MRLDLLAAPLEHFDERLTDLFAGAPLLVALGIALAIGLRHASDPDHLVAVTSLIVRDDGDMRLAARIGAFWGIGHAVTLVVLGTPLIVFKSALPAWLERGAETGVGLIILALAVRIVWRWARGDYRVGRHRHDAPVAGVHEGTHAHVRVGGGPGHGHPGGRSPRQALYIGALHGLAGTGAVVLLLIAALPGRLEATLALFVFALMSVLSMTGLTIAFSWVLTGPVVGPVYRSVLIPLFGMFGLALGLSYTGIV